MGNCAKCGKNVSFGTLCGSCQQMIDNERQIQNEQLREIERQRENRIEEGQQKAEKLYADAINNINNEIMKKFYKKKQEIEYYAKQRNEKPILISALAQFRLEKIIRMDFNSVGIIKGIRLHESCSSSSRAETKTAYETAISKLSKIAEGYKNFFIDKNPLLLSSEIFNELEKKDKILSIDKISTDIFPESATNDAIVSSLVGEKKDGLDEIISIATKGSAYDCFPSGYSRDVFIKSHSDFAAFIKSLDLMLKNYKTQIKELKNPQYKISEDYYLINAFLITQETPLELDTKNPALFLMTQDDINENLSQSENDLKLIDIQYQTILYANPDELDIVSSICNEGKEKSKNQIFSYIDSYSNKIIDEGNNLIENVLQEKAVIEKNNSRKFLIKIISITLLVLIIIFYFAYGAIIDSINANKLYDYKTATNDIKKIKLACIKFRNQVGKFPNHFSEIKKYYIGNRKDPWGNNYRIQIVAQNHKKYVKISSAGSDEKHNTSDDIYTLIIYW